MGYLSSVSLTDASTANSGSTSVTVPSGAKLAVVSFSGWLNSAPDYPSPISGGTHTLGGAAIVFPSGAGDANNTTYLSAIGYVINPPTGSQTFAWDVKGTTTLFGDGTTWNFAFYDDVVSGVRASGGAQDASLDSGGPATISSLGSASGDLVVAACAAYGASGTTFTWGGGPSQRVGLHSGSGGNLSSADFSASGSSTITCYTSTSGDGSVSAIAFIPSGGGAATSSVSNTAQRLMSILLPNF